MAAPSVKQRKVATSTGAAMTATLETTPTKGNLLVLRIGLRVAKKAEIEGWTNVTPNESGQSQILARFATAADPGSVTFTPGNTGAMELTEIAPSSGEWKSLAEAIPLSGTNPVNNPAVKSAPTPTLKPNAEALLLANLGITFSAVVTVNEPFALKTSQGARSLFTADASGAAGEYTCTFSLGTEQTCQAGIIAVVNPSVEHNKVDGEAELTGTGTSTVQGAVRKNAQATITGTGSTGIRGSVRKNADATLTGAGTSSIAGVVRVNGEANLEGEGTLQQDGSIVHDGGASLTGTGSLTAEGAVRRNGSANLSGLGSAEVVGSRRRNGSADLAGLGTTTVSGGVRSEGIALLTGEGGLLAEGSVGGQLIASYERSTAAEYGASSDSEYADAVGASPRTGEYEE